MIRSGPQEMENIFWRINIEPEMMIPSFSQSIIQKANPRISYIIPDIKYVIPQKPSIQEKTTWNLDFSNLNKKQLENIAQGLGLQTTSIGKIEMAKTKIKEFLVAKGVNTEVLASLFVDYEDENWKALRLTIPIDKERYNLGMEDEIIRKMLDQLGEELSDRIVIQIKPY